MGLRIVSKSYLDHLEKENEMLHNHRNLKESDMAKDLRHYKQIIKDITTNSKKMTKHEIVDKLKELEN